LNFKFQLRIFSNPKPNPKLTHLPKHQTLVQALIISFLSVFDM